MSEKTLRATLEEHLDVARGSLQIYRRSFERRKMELIDHLATDTSHFRTGLVVKHARRTKELSLALASLAQDMVDIEFSIEEYEEILNTSKNDPSI